MHAYPAAVAEEQQAEKQPGGALNPDQWNSFKLQMVKPITKTTKLFRQVHGLGLMVMPHLSCPDLVQ